jgi:hypothetical protein
MTVNRRWSSRVPLVKGVEIPAFAGMTVNRRWSSRVPLVKGVEIPAFAG